MDHTSSLLQQYFPWTFGRKEEPELPHDVKQRRKIRAWMSCIICHSRFSFSENGESFPVFTFQILASKWFALRVWDCIGVSNRAPLPAFVYTAIGKTLAGLEEEDDGDAAAREEEYETKNEWMLKRKGTDAGFFQGSFQWGRHEAARRYSKSGRPITPFPAIFDVFCLFNWYKTLCRQLLTTCQTFAEYGARYSSLAVDLHLR